MGVTNLNSSLEARGQCQSFIYFFKSLKLKSKKFPALLGAEKPQAKRLNYGPLEVPPSRNLGK